MIESDLMIWPGGLIGFRLVSKQIKDGDVTKNEIQHVEGAILALRKNGDEALFASSVEDSRVPAEWIPIKDFIVNPVAIATEDDFFDDEPDPLPGGVDSEPQDRPPMEPRRPGLGVKRRGE